MNDDPRAAWQLAVRRAVEPPAELRRGFTGLLQHNLDTVLALTGLRMSTTRRMLDSHADGLEVVRYLMNEYFDAPSQGFLNLKACGQLKLSIEASILDPQFSELFLDIEKEWARQRLAEHGYRPRRKLGSDTESDANRRWP